MNLIRQLSKVDPQWRINISSDPIEAAIELGIIEPEDVDPEMPKELNFHSSEVDWFGEYDYDE